MSGTEEKLTLAPELVQARERIGFTQAQLAAASGVSLSAIKGYETGRTFPGARELRLLCQALRITPNKLLFGVEAPFPEAALNPAAKFPGHPLDVVHRARIRFLVNLLTADECAAFYGLMSAIVLARHGASELDSNEEAADLFAGLEAMQDGKGFDLTLFRAITKNPDTLKEFVDATKAAAREAQVRKGDD